MTIMTIIIMIWYLDLSEIWECKTTSYSSYKIQNAMVNPIRISYNRSQVGWIPWNLLLGAGSTRRSPAALHHWSQPLRDILSQARSELGKDWENMCCGDKYCNQPTKMGIASGMQTWQLEIPEENGGFCMDCPLPFSSGWINRWCHDQKLYGRMLIHVHSCSPKASKKTQWISWLISPLAP